MPNKGWSSEKEDRGATYATIIEENTLLLLLLASWVRIRDRGPPPNRVWN